MSRRYRDIAPWRLGRPLQPWEGVHHIDGRHEDEHPDNLMVLLGPRAHALQHCRPRTYLTFAVTSAGICLLTLAMVLSFDTPQLDNALAFIGGLAETLLVALAFPRSRQHLLETFQPGANSQPGDAAEPSKRTVK